MFRLRIKLVSAIALGLGLGVVVLIAPQAMAGTSQASDPCPAATVWHRGVEAHLNARYGKLKSIVPSNPRLAAELAQRYAQDQAVRKALVAAGPAAMTNAKSPQLKRMAKVDAGNLAWLKPEIEKHGFPTVKEVGVKGVEHAWMLVQHADADPHFQARVLKQIKPRLGTDGFIKHDYAMLDDRVRLELGKNQLYGTQFKPEGGQAYLQPTDDMAGLAKRRADMDLMPMADYVCELRHAYHTPVHLSPPPKSGAAK